MYNLTKRIAFLYLPLVAPIVHASQLSGQEEMTFSLPINAATQPKFHLFVKSLKNFQTTPQYIESSMRIKPMVIEFIPKGESFENWSKIFTIHSFIGGRISAPKLTQFKIDSLSQHISRSLVISSTTEEHYMFQVSKVSFQYVTREGEVELLYMQYYSGPYDCSGVQYTEKLESWLDINAAITKTREIEKALEEYVKVSSF